MENKIDWEYQTIFIREDKYLGKNNEGEEVTETSEDEYVELNQLQEMGREGWELVTTRTKPCQQSKAFQWVIHYFKRPLVMNKT